MNTPTWANAATFYHIYPLAQCAAPARNDFYTAPTPRLDALYPWLDQAQSLGANALYLGPLFESTAHGYDSADYYHVDRRLGERATLTAFAREVHRRGMRLVLDGVFNHVGRDFWAFRDLQANRERSAYLGWFDGVDFSRRSPCGDPFSYTGWAGNYDLVKLNLANPDVRAHLLGAVSVWHELFEIDGLRLDAADVIDPDFFRALSAHCRALSPDFWLMGEMVHGDYRSLAAPGLLDSVTNYECYKGLYSSLNDQNYFEIAYALARQSGSDGIYRHLTLYNFVDNHDVDRVASSLKDPAHLYPLYCLLFSMPGIPSIYYGSEWGQPGQRTPFSDAALRPCLTLGQPAPLPNLSNAIARLAALRQAQPALREGGYQELHVSASQLAFLRTHPGGDVVVALNAASAPAALTLRLPTLSGHLRDLLNPGSSFPIVNGVAHLDPIPACWARILAVE
jgi:cyclomaltodextrinase